MLRVRPGVLLVRANFEPTRELITLDFPTLDRPRNAISGTPGAGNCFKSLAESTNLARIRIQTVSSVGVKHGKRRRGFCFAGMRLHSYRKTQFRIWFRMDIALAIPKVLRNQRLFRLCL